MRLLSLTANDVVLDAANGLQLGLRVSGVQLFQIGLEYLLCGGVGGGGTAISNMQLLATWTRG